MKHLPLYLLSAVTIAALIGVLVLARENAALRRELAGAPAAPAVASVPKAADDPVKAPPAAQSTAADAAAQPDASAVTRETPPRRPFDRRARGQEFFAQALADPQARAAMLTRIKSEIDRRFGDYFVKLGLNETQIEALRSIMADRQLARMQAGMLERTAETDQERADAQSWRDTKLASTEADINAILGPDGLKNLQGYLDSAPQRQVVDDVARRATYAGAPLTDDVNGKLLAAIQQASAEHPVPQMPGPGRGFWGGGADRAPITQDSVNTYLNNLRAQNQQVIESARGFMTQPQLEALADQQIDQMQQAEAQMKFLLENPDVRDFAGRRGGRGPGGG